MSDASSRVWMQHGANVCLLSALWCASSQAGEGLECECNIKIKIFLGQSILEMLFIKLLVARKTEKVMYFYFLPDVKIKLFIRQYLLLYQ